MAGQNAFAFNGTAFVPEDRNLTASISVFTTPTTRLGVARAYTMAEGVSASQMWIGFPPIPAITEIANERTGSFPNLNNSIVVKWSSDTSSIIASFTVFAKIGSGSYAPVATVASNLRQYIYGPINANTQYDFYVRSNGVAGLNSTSTPSGISLASPAQVGVLSSSSTTTTATVSWSVPAGVYQRFEVRDAGTLLTTINATTIGTSYSFTRTGLTEGTSYNFRVVGINYNNHSSELRQVDVATQVLVVPTISWEDTSKTKYSDFRVSWSGSTGVSYQPEISSNNVNWSNLGTAQSGTGTKYSDYTSPGHNNTRYIRVYVYDANGATRYTNTRSVTPGFTSTSSGWGWDNVIGAESDRIDSLYTVRTPSSFDTSSSLVHNTERILWGNSEALILRSTDDDNVRVVDFRVTATLITSGVSLSSNLRRVFINVANNGGRSTAFDNLGSGSRLTLGGAIAYYNTGSERNTGPLLTWGVRDNRSFWDKFTNGRWEYDSVSGTGNGWPSGRVEWEAELRWHRQEWLSVTSSADSTYS
jgi:hypothetical protein